MPTTRGLKAELAAILVRVRRRWRLQRALLGTVWFLGAGACVGLIAAFTVDAWRFAPQVVTGARIASYLFWACALLFFIGIPAFRRVPDRRLALYLEEREPSLGMAFASATELADNAGNGDSPGLERGLLEQSVTACHEVDDGRRVDAPALRRNALLVAAGIAAIILVAEHLPANLRDAFRLIVLPRTSAASVSPYHQIVEPGDILVSRGADQLIVARAQGFEPQEVALLTRFGNDAEWQRAAMVPGGDSRGFEIFLFDLARSGDYQVLAEGLRSRVYRIEVADLPEVERIDLTYHYPARLALPPRTVVDAGDISSVRGSRVAITIIPSQNVAKASLVLNGRETLAMTKNDDGSWTTELTIDEEGQYRIELPYGDDTQAAASPSYAIEVLADRAPTVTLSRSGRDSRVTSVEEALIEVSGRGDLNIATLELVYAINDQPEETVLLYQGDEAATDVTAGYTLNLEDYALSPGDLIAYYARAADSTAANALTSTTDIFFMQVRPFDRRFRRSQGGGGASGGMQTGDQERSLSAQQRQLVIATFKLARDRDSYDEARFTDTVETLETAQRRIRDRVEAIVRRIGTRNVMGQNAGVQRMREELPQAVTAMKETQQRLREEAPVEALPPARKALQHLQRAEAAFHDAQIAFGRSAGRAARDAEDLANLFRLEMDKLRNKYEGVQRGNWKQGTQELDEALKKLAQLASRQQREVERLERRARLNPNAPAGGGSQRALAEELEEMVRRLERLSRKQTTPELRNLVRQARAAAQAMRRAGAEDGNGAADARAALERLKNIQRLADKKPQEQLERGIDSASRRTQRLAREHADIGAGMQALPEEEAARGERKSKLQSRKLRMAGEVRDLESALRQLANDASKERRATSRALRNTADSIDKDSLADNIERSAAAIDGPSKDASRHMESAIGESLARVGEGLAEAARSIDSGDRRKRARKLAQMRALVEGLESLERRMLQRSRSDQANAGGPGGGWGAADGRSRINRDFDPTDIADFRRDFADQRGLLDRLAGVMSPDEHGARDISRLLGEMRALEQSEDFGDARRAMQRQRQLIAQLKELELGLKGGLEEVRPRVLAATGNDVTPPEYRLQVEEYFRDLSRAESSRRKFSGAD